MPAAANVMRVGLPLPSLAMVMPTVGDVTMFSILTAVATETLPVWSVLLYAEMYARPASDRNGTAVALLPMALAATFLLSPLCTVSNSSVPASGVVAAVRSVILTLAMRCPS